MLHRFGLCLTAFCLLLAMTGCSALLGEESSDTADDSAAVTLSTTTTTPTTSATAPATTAAPTDLNPLTGLNDLQAGASTRFTGIMIGNNDKSRPQYGLDKADLFVEAETEGGITRIMAVFANASRVPAQLGPVRSARTPFVLLSQSLDLIYCHAGGSKTALAKLKELDLADVDALHYEGSTFWRDATLRKTKGYEYSLMTSGSKLVSRAKEQNFRTASKNGVPFTFSSANASSGEAATQIQCRVSGNQTVNFKYYPGENRYYKRNRTLDNPSTHASADGTQLYAANVIVLFDRKYSENSTTIGFDLKSGSGLLFTGGKARSIQWSRSASGLRFTESDGSAAKVSTGKTYIILTSQTYREYTFYRA